MLKSILSLSGVKELDKNSQNDINGGLGPVNVGIDCYPDRPAGDCRKIIKNDGCISWSCGSEDEYL